MHFIELLVVPFTFSCFLYHGFAHFKRFIQYFTHSYGFLYHLGVMFFRWKATPCVSCILAQLYCNCSCLYFISVHAHGFFKWNKVYNLMIRGHIWLNPHDVFSNAELWIFTALMLKYKTWQFWHNGILPPFLKAEVALCKHYTLWRSPLAEF